MGDHARHSHRSAKPGARAPGTQTGRSAPHAVLALQAAAGNRAVTQVVTRQRTLSRTPTEVSSPRLVRALASLDIVKITLSKVLPQKRTVEEYLTDVLAAYDAHFARASDSARGRRRNEGMRLAAILSAVAGAVARSAGDPHLRPLLAKELGRVFRAEIRQALAGEHGTGHRHKQALELATGLAGDDTIVRYVRGKLRKEDAAWNVRRVAQRIGAGNDEAFEMLREQFEIELAGHTLSGAAAGEAARDKIVEKAPDGTVVKVGDAGFELTHLLGEVPRSFLNEVAATENDRLKWSAGGGLEFTAGMAQKLADLKAAVTDPNLPAVALTPQELAAEQSRSGAGLTLAQSTHFHRLRQDEVAESADYEGKGASARTWVRDKLKSRYNLATDNVADQLITDVLAQIVAAPLTLTQNLEQFFGPRADKANEPAWGTAYTPELERGLETHQLSDLLLFNPAKTDGGAALDKPVELLGKPHKEGMEARGRNYLRWRREKDERETGMHQLPLADFPAFAAVNPTFTQTLGASANKAVRDDATGGWKGDTWGVNYYGDFHMVLKPAVRSRATFISRGSTQTSGRRIERTDLTLLLADMMRIGDWDFVDAFVAIAKGFPVNVLTSMNLEIHIYGGLDLGRDVATFYMQPAAFAATTGAADRAKKFAAARGIAVQSVGAAPPGFSVKSSVKGNPADLDVLGWKPGQADLREHFGTKPQPKPVAVAVGGGSH